MGAQGNRIDRILQYLEKLNPSLQHIIKFFNQIMEERDQAIEQSKGLQNIITETQKELSESKTLCSTMHEHVLMTEINYLMAFNRFQVLLMELFLKDNILITEVLPLVKMIAQITKEMSKKNLTAANAYTVKYQCRYKSVIASRTKEFKDNDISSYNIAGLDLKGYTHKTS